MSHRKTDDNDTALHLYLSQKNIEKIGKKLKVESYVNKELDQLQRKFVTKSELLQMIKKLLEAYEPSEIQQETPHGQNLQDTSPVEIKLEQFSPNHDQDNEQEAPELTTTTSTVITPGNKPAEFKQEIPSIELSQVQNDSVLDLNVPIPILNVPEVANVNVPEVANVNVPEVANVNVPEVANVNVPEVANAQPESVENNDTMNADESKRGIKIDAQQETYAAKNFVAIRNNRVELTSVNLPENIVNSISVNGIRVIPQIDKSPNKSDTLIATLSNIQVNATKPKEYTIVSEKDKTQKLSFHKKPIPPMRRKYFESSKTLPEIIDEMDGGKPPVKEQTIDAKAIDVPMVEISKNIETTTQQESETALPENKLDVIVIPKLDKTNEPYEDIAIPKLENSSEEKCETPLSDDDIAKILRMDQKALSHLLLRIMGEKSTSWGNDCTSDLIVKSKDEFVLLQKYRNANPLHDKLIKDLDKTKKKMDKEMKVLKETKDDKEKKERRKSGFSNFLHKK